MKHRAGLTLVEVLVAIFVMGIGLLAIMTLFPLGIMNYSQAMQDDRAAIAAANAAAIANAMDLRHNPTFLVGATPTAIITVYGAKTAVYVDPWYNAIGHTTVTDGTNTIPRVGVNTTIWPSPYQQWFGLNDDFEFLTNGVPDGATGTAGIVKPAGYYTWCYMLRRPFDQGATTQAQNDPYFSDMSIVIYKGRSTQVFSGEDPLRVTAGAVNTTTLTLAAGQAAPAIRKTGWILDVNTAQFYRVISVVLATNGVYHLETQIPLKAAVTHILVMENVVEVIEKGFGWQP